MIANALFLTTVIFIAVGLVVLEECKFLIPYRNLLYHKYGDEIAVFAALLFGNLFAGTLAISRHFHSKIADGSFRTSRSSFVAGRAFPRN